MIRIIRVDQEPCVGKFLTVGADGNVQVMAVPITH